MLDLSDEQQMIVAEARRIAENEFAADACQWNGEKPWENLETLSEYGLLGISLPTEYGGSGMDEFAAILLREVIGRVCLDTAYALPDTGAPRTVAMFGTEAAKEKYLRPICEAEGELTIAISEQRPDRT